MSYMLFPFVLSQLSPSLSERQDVRQEVELHLGAEDEVVDGLGGDGGEDGGGAEESYWG